MTPASPLNCFGETIETVSSPHEASEPGHHGMGLAGMSLLEATTQLWKKDHLVNALPTLKRMRQLQHLKSTSLAICANIEMVTQAPAAWRPWKLTETQTMLLRLMIRRGNPLRLSRRLSLLLLPESTSLETGMGQRQEQTYSLGCCTHEPEDTDIALWRFGHPELPLANLCTGLTGTSCMGLKVMRANQFALLGTLPLSMATVKGAEDQQLDLEVGVRTGCYAYPLASLEVISHMLLLYPWSFG
eukprot:jgi/Botrbrau1/11570/Bobra.60_1s0021.1